MNTKTQRKKICCLGPTPQPKEFSHKDTKTQRHKNSHESRVLCRESKLKPKSQILTPK